MSRQTTPLVITPDESGTSEGPGGLARRLSTRGTKVIVNLVECAVVILALLVVVYLFVAQPHQVDGNSMVPNFIHEQYLLTNKISYKVGQPKRGDVVVFKHSETQDYIKRIIAVHDETVWIEDGDVYVDGERLDESAYLDMSVRTLQGSVLKEGVKMTVGENQVFVLGDNRPHSSDSRSFGLLEESEIKGKVWLVVWPFSDFHFVSRSRY